MASKADKTVESAVLGAARQIEKALDDELDNLNNLGEDDIEGIRRRRLAEMKKKAEMDLIWRRRGHGKLAQITEKDFFQHAKEADRFVLLVTRRGTTRFAQDMEEHLGKIAEHHMETYFAVVSAEKSPFLCEKFNLRVMPSLLLVKDQQVDRVLHGLDALTDHGKLETSLIESRLYDLGLVTHMDIADSQ